MSRRPGHSRTRGEEVEAKKSIIQSVTSEGPWPDEEAEELVWRSPSGRGCACRACFAAHVRCQFQSGAAAPDRGFWRVQCVDDRRRCFVESLRHAPAVVDCGQTKKSTVVLWRQNPSKHETARNGGGAGPTTPEAAIRSGRPPRCRTDFDRITAYRAARC